MRKYLILGLLLAPVMPGCVVLYMDEVSRIGEIKASMEKDDMVVEYIFDRNRTAELVEMKVYMLIDKAAEIGAPASVRFMELLGERIVQQESLIGHKLCPQGSKPGNVPFDVRQDGEWEDIMQVRLRCKPAN